MKIRHPQPLDKVSIVLSSFFLRINPTNKAIINTTTSNSIVKNIKYVEYKPFVRPTSVPRLISTSKKFRNLTKWEPIISFNKILDETLDYWRDEVGKNHSI